MKDIMIGWLWLLVLVASGWLLIYFIFKTVGYMYRELQMWLG